MLHPNAKNRLMRVCPTEIEVQWIHPVTGEDTSTTVEPDIRWKTQDQPISYPVISMELSPEGVPQHAFGDREGDDTIIHPKPNEDEVAYDLYIGTPMYAELHITVAVATSHAGMPDHMVADAIANEVFYEYEYNSEHLHRQGTTQEGEPVDYEWPMAVSKPDDVGIRNLNRVIDGQNVQRRALQFEVEYRWWRHEEVPATDALDIEFELIDPAERTIAEYDKYIDLHDDEWLDGD